MKSAELVLVGKANFSTHWQPNVEELAAEYKQKLLELLPDATPEAFDVEIWLSQSSIDLAVVAGPRDEAPHANDTSFAAVSLPRSPLERTVHAVEKHLNSDGYRVCGSRRP